MSLLGFLLIISGILILRYAIRSAILAAGKLSEEGGEELADLLNSPGPAFRSSFHGSQVSAEAQHDHV